MFLEVEVGEAIKVAEPIAIRESMAPDKTGDPCYVINKWSLFLAFVSIRRGVTLRHNGDVSNQNAASPHMHPEGYLARFE